MNYPEHEPETGELSVNDFKGNYGYGFVLIYKSLIDHEVSGFTKPYKRSEAWLWLLLNACRLKDGRNVYRKVGKATKLIFEGYGVCAHSTRFLASKFGWSRGKTEKWLNDLKTCQQIDVNISHNISQITICNFYDYQNPKAAKKAIEKPSKRPPTEPPTEPKLNSYLTRKQYANANGDFHKMQNWIWETLPHVSKIEKQLTYDECERLIDDYSRDILLDVLEAMENTKGVEKKYTSVNKTVRNWANRRKNSDNGKHDPIEDEIKRTWGRSD